MSEEKAEPTADKGSKLKLKLRKMGVMRDDNAGPADKSQSFWHGKEPVIIVVFLALVFGWWYTQRANSPAAPGTQYSPPSQATGYPPGQGYGPPPRGQSYGPPPGWANGPRGDSSGRPSANAGNDTYSTPPQAPPGWRGPGNRYDDRYGPPPGWRPVYPPPPPTYYGYPYYGPPPNYPNPYYPGYNGPPPPQNN